jgi:hypothetical protein
VIRGMMPLGGTTEEMLTDLAERTGGIPSFAIDALRGAGIDADELRRADEAGRKSTSAPRT